MAIAAGQIIRAAFLDRLDSPPLVALRQTVAQSIINASWVAIAFDTEDVDSYGGHSTVTNTSRYTAQYSGWYAVCGMTSFAPNSTGFRTARIQVNGSALLGTQTYGTHNGSAEAMIITPTRDVYLTAGDYVEVAGYQSSGGSLNTAVSGLGASLWLRYSHA